TATTAGRSGENAPAEPAPDPGSGEKTSRKNDPPAERPTSTPPAGSGTNDGRPVITIDPDTREARVTLPHPTIKGKTVTIRVKRRPEILIDE
ncbi:MAG: hypothetical protein ACYC9O_06940, partial [Candidatus Latescibacterota bacterium]